MVRLRAKMYISKNIVNVYLEYSNIDKDIATTEHLVKDCKYNPEDDQWLVIEFEQLSKIIKLLNNDGLKCDIVNLVSNLIEEMCSHKDSHMITNMTFEKDLMLESNKSDIMNILISGNKYKYNEVKISFKLSNNISNIDISSINDTDNASFIDLLVSKISNEVRDRCGIKLDKSTLGCIESYLMHVDSIIGMGNMFTSSIDIHIDELK